MSLIEQQVDLPRETSAKRTRQYLNFSFSCSHQRAGCPTFSLITAIPLLTPCQTYKLYFGSHIKYILKLKLEVFVILYPYQTFITFSRFCTYSTHFQALLCYTNLLLSWKITFGSTIYSSPLRTNDTTFMLNQN